MLSETVRNFILQGVAICDIQVEKGKNEIKQLEKEFGKERAIFIKTDVFREDEVEGLLQVHELILCSVTVQI
jgi:NADP-dependent 3-hydroxy acid dehydrogenase YdfG